MKPVVPIVLIAAQFSWASPLTAQEPASTATDAPARAAVKQASPEPAQAETAEALESASAPAGPNPSSPNPRRASIAAAAKPAKVAQARSGGKKAAFIAVIALAVVIIMSVAGKCDKGCQNDPAPR